MFKKAWGVIDRFCDWFEGEPKVSEHTYPIRPDFYDYRNPGQVIEEGAEMYAKALLWLPLKLGKLVGFK
jgi:hypothetical protein